MSDHNTTTQLATRITDRRQRGYDAAVKGERRLIPTNAEIWRRRRAREQATRR